MKSFSYWSPSQVDTFTLCNRKWWFNKIMGLEIPQHPSAALGEKVHKELENYLEHGDPKVLGPIAKAGLSFLPTPGTVLIEYDLSALGLTAAGLPALGRIDCLNLRSEPPEVIDHKTIGNIDYAKTNEELAKNVQMTVYARAATVELERMGVPTPDVVRVSHIAYQTKGSPVARKASADLTQERIARNWSGIDAKVREMKDVALALSPDRVTPTKSACDAFGGCHFRDRCRALNAVSHINPTPTPNGDTVPDPKANPLLARLGVKTKAASEAEAAPPVEPVESAPAPAPATTGKASVLDRLRKAAENPPVTDTILPPDTLTDAEVAQAIAGEETAAADAVTAKAEETAAKAAAKAKPASEDTGDKTRRPRNALPRLMALGYSGDDVASMDTATMHAILDGKVKKGDSVPVPAPAPAAVVDPAPAPTVPPEVASLPAPAPIPSVAPSVVPVPTSPAAVVSGGGLALYIDCRPVKGGEVPTDLTDLLAPLMRAVASDAGVDHYTMVPYGQGPARVAALVARNPWTTGVLFVDSRAPAAQAVLEVLRPYATLVVQGR